MQSTGRVVALGFFDGVHKGHASLLQKTKERALELGAAPSMLTFDTPPKQLVTGGIELLNSREDREYIVKRFFGIEDIIIIHFDEKMMHMPWQDFVELMRGDYKAIHFVVGDDFRFGFRGEGTAEKLREAGERLGFGCDVLPKVQVDGVTVSSTYIRELMRSGEMAEAVKMLGHGHILTGPVTHGDGIGHKLEAPTLNLHFGENVLVPSHGVYAAMIRFEGEEGAFRAVTNIGVRPTVTGKGEVSVESFLLDFNRNVYGKLAVCELYAFLRPERKFPGLEELKNQIKEDVRHTEEFFANFPAVQ